MRILFLILSLLFASLSATSAYAQNDESPKVKIRLLPEHANVQPGEELWIGIDQSIAQGWHTYWKNPGDSGTPLNISWTNLDIEAGPLHWPSPHKIPYERLMNYGYENKLVVLQKLKLPENLPTHLPVTLTANIEILVCKETCIPEYGTYNLTLNEPDTRSEDNSAFINKARQNLPQNAGWTASFNQVDQDLVLKLNPPAELLKTINLASIELFPEDWGLISNPVKTQAFIQDGALIIKQTRGERPLKEIKQTSGILAFETNDGVHAAYHFTATKNAAKTIQQETSKTAQSGSLNFITAALFALLGGLILNLMPCVFPVLSIKALSLIKISEKHPDLARLHGLSYTAGVILSFLLIAGVLITLQAGGAQIGWGFQLQNPWIVGTLGYLLFIIGLNLIGFFEFANPFANTGGKLTQNDGLAGSFFTGILATLVATPCTAPFMAGAIGYAFIQPPIVSLVIFTMLGLGLALPYLALSFVPALQKIMPKPGAWMVIFKQALSFPMFIAALWLLWVLAQQTDAYGITAALLGAISIAFGLWLLRHCPKNKTTLSALRIMAGLSFLGALALLPICARPCAQPMGGGLTQTLISLPYSQETLQSALDSDDPVFTEMTAAWCITCKVNHAVAINIDSTKTLFSKHNIRYIVGDWTNEDPEITKYLRKHGRSGVPLYVYYGPRDPETGRRPDAKILPQVLTPAIVKNFIENNT
ncbi:MAG TPA: protein-disulfide reductase DsbD family protein [Alphaproteobacteria bacterium]|nr:thioredoxin family protein [Alphaproteobacteria bacterium]USO05365.1 MAG: thioredoxin family protein [Rhodospirillales bacterium]HOO82314.1 protein-disulfide reductase DsbD family protein [Alphaproteobacteria bacterium]